RSHLRHSPHVATDGRRCRASLLRPTDCGRREAGPYDHAATPGRTALVGRSQESATDTGRSSAPVVAGVGTPPRNTDPTSPWPAGGFASATWPNARQTPAGHCG